MRPLQILRPQRSVVGQQNACLIGFLRVEVAVTRDMQNPKPTLLQERSYRFMRGRRGTEVLNAWMGAHQFFQNVVFGRGVG